MSIVKANGYAFIEECRNCKHNNAWHVNGHNNEIIVPCGHSKSWHGKDGNCECENFVPTDNLKYLEYILDKRTSI
jgi:hypothetical protein